MLGPPLMAEGRVPARMLPWAGGGTRLSSRCSLIYPSPLGQERGEAGPRLGRWPHAHLSPSTLGTRSQSAGRAGKGPGQPPLSPALGFVLSRQPGGGFMLLGSWDGGVFPGSARTKGHCAPRGSPSHGAAPALPTAPPGARKEQPPPRPQATKVARPVAKERGAPACGALGSQRGAGPPPGWLHRGALRLSEHTELEQLPALLPALSEIPKMCPRPPEGWGQWGGSRWVTRVKLKPVAAKHGCQPGTCPQGCQQFGCAPTHPGHSRTAPREQEPLSVPTSLSHHTHLLCLAPIHVLGGYVHIYTEGAVQTTRAGSPQPRGRDPSEQTLSSPPCSHGSSPSRPQGGFPTEPSKQGST